MSNWFSIEGKTALVTGGSRGIGEMIAAGFLLNGARVYINSRKVDVCNETAARLATKYGGDCIAIPGDMSDVGSIEDVFNELAKHEERLDILVNNAGATWGAPIDEFPESGWDKVMDTNVKAMFFLTQQFIKLLEENGTNEDPSRIINIGSIDGLGIPRAETYSYPASKAAVHHLTKVMANRLAERNINVNAIAPGPFESQMMKSTLKSFSEEIINSVPRKRIGKPEDMAGASIFLSSKSG